MDAQSIPIEANACSRPKGKQSMESQSPLLPCATAPQTSSTPNIQVRDLEARVEILSGDKDERIELMLLLVRNLLQENKELRNMMKSMSTFFGDGKLNSVVRTPVLLD